MEGAFPSSFPANYVTLKDLQERWIKRKQDEENESKLRILRQQESIKPHNDNAAENLNRHPKSKSLNSSAKKSLSSESAPTSHCQAREQKEKSPAIKHHNDSTGKNLNHHPKSKNLNRSARKFLSSESALTSHCQKRWIKRKQDEENESKFQSLPQQAPMKLHNDNAAKNLNHHPKSKNLNSSAKKSLSFESEPTSYCQERWIKHKEDEENESKLHSLPQQEPIKPHDDIAAENLNQHPKSSNLNSSARKALSSESAPISQCQAQEQKEKHSATKLHSNNTAKKHHPKSKNPNRSTKKFLSSESAQPSLSQARKLEKKSRADGFDANKSKLKKEVDSKSEASTAIAGKGRKKKGGPARIPTSTSKSVAKIVRSVADLSIAGRRRGGGSSRVSASGMVWVRKTTGG